MTIAELTSMTFGYLSGQDLLDFCPSQFLINQETVTAGILQRSVQKAYSEIIRKLSAKTQIAQELKKTAPTDDNTDTRVQVIVKYTALSAVKNIVSKAAGLPDHMKNNFAEVNEAIHEIQQGIQGIPELAIDNPSSDNHNANISRAKLVNSNFKTIG